MLQDRLQRRICLILLAGRPGTGKIALMVQIGQYNAAPLDVRGEPRPPLNVALFSLEVGNAELTARALASASSPA